MNIVLILKKTMQSLFPALRCLFLSIVFCFWSDLCNFYSLAQASQNIISIYNNLWTGEQLGDDCHSCFEDKAERIDVISTVNPYQFNQKPK